MDQPTEQQIEEAAALMQRARNLVFFTGAGMSQESGIPTFRDAMDGIWQKFQPEDLATPEAFARDPHRVRAFYEYRRDFVRRATPNPGHLAVADAQGLFSTIVITQNVDCLHEAAGSQNVIRLHGEILSNRCNHGCPGVQPASETVCPVCGRDSLRPNVVWFGETLDPECVEQAAQALAAADVLVVVGTSGVVYPAAGLIDIARASGVPFIEINPRATQFSTDAALVLPLPAATVLPDIVACIKKQR